MAAVGEMSSRQDGTVLDYVGIGFGPSNLALAIAAEERAPALRGMFVEMSSAFKWHAGMLLDHSRMQVSFLKDLVTLRNPTSRYSFLQYLKSHGRLERFANLREFYPSRVEYSDYLSWVAQAFDEQVRYAEKVRSVSLAEPRSAAGRCFRIEVEDLARGGVRVYTARNVVYAPGGVPNLLPDRIEPSPRIVHSSRFLDDFVRRFPDRTRNYVFAVAGGGQSAAEIAHYLLREFEACVVHLVFPGFALRPADSSPFVNQLFFSKERDEFYRLSEGQRSRALGQARNTNYGVVDDGLLRELYKDCYADEVRGLQRLFACGGQRVAGARHAGDDVALTITDASGCESTLRCDGLVLATGYRRELDGVIFRDVLPLIDRLPSGGVTVSSRYRVRMNAELDGGLFVQGLNEETHGVGDTLLSQLPFRASEIVDEIATTQRAPVEPQHHGNGKPVPADGEYPPVRHLEHDRERMYAVMTSFPFATIISVDDGGLPLVTHAPLILNRTRGALGTLFGHMDRYNPHAALLDGRNATIVFHGPNSYISPMVYESDQLPTWNSVAVHVTGRVSRIEDRAGVIRGLQSICELADPGADAYRLPDNEPRIPLLIDYIVGFEVEIVRMTGRFKLSQDRNEADRARAAEALIRRGRASEQDVVKIVCGLDAPV